MNKPDIFRPMYFRLNDWKQCFATWHTIAKQMPNHFQLILNTHPYTSGYYIEQLGNVINQLYDHVYIGNEVAELEKRVKAKTAKCEKAHTAPGLIL